MHPLGIVLSAVWLLWIALGVFHFWSSRGATVLRPSLLADVPRQPPRVSIMVPARNEEEWLAASLASLLCLDYPDYEVILVDDDSTDRTRTIADGWALRPESRGRLRVIHNRTLPPGWRGKVWALEQAFQAARGEWLLATDADVVFHPKLLRLALATAIKKDLHLLSVVPEFEYGCFWERVVMPAFSFLVATLFPLRLVNRPGFPRALAAGAFILMRRQDLVDLGGYERLRSAVIEDLRTAELFKNGGRRIHVALSRGLFVTRMYQNTRELWQGMSRSAFEGVDFSIVRALAGIVIGNLLAVLPWVVVVARLWLDLAHGHALWTDSAFRLAVAGCGTAALVYGPFLVPSRVSLAYVVTLPLATLFYSGATANSMLKGLFGTGVAWKGRQYRPPADR